MGVRGWLDYEGMIEALRDARIKATDYEVRKAEIVHIFDGVGLAVNNLEVRGTLSVEGKIAVYGTLSLTDGGTINLVDGGVIEQW